MRPAQSCVMQNEGALCFKCKVGRWVLCLPDVAHLGPVLQEPTIGHLVFPAHVPGVLPQQPDLVAGVSSVPQRVSEMLSWTCLRLNSLDNDMSELLEQNAQITFLDLWGSESVVTVWLPWIWAKA